jgi:hypothetical protein
MGDQEGSFQHLIKLRVDDLDDGRCKTDESQSPANYIIKNSHSSGSRESDDDEILNLQIKFGDETEEQNAKNESQYDDLLMQRKEGHVAQPYLMVSVNNNMRMNWDLLIIMLALYNCVMIPLNVAFNVELELSGGIGGLEKLIDVLFILDIILNFRTTFINPKTNIEISDNKRVA